MNEELTICIEIHYDNEVLELERDEECDFD